MWTPPASPGPTKNSANWMTYGRTYSEQRFSPLARITADNTKQLGLAWYAELDTNRGQEATPLVIDGVLYVSTAWSMVKAYNAKTGTLLWSYDPAVPRALGVRGCCDVVSRGVAAWKGKIFVGTFDGRLVAIDARTGTPVWNVMTVDPSKPYTITQAPRVIKGRVVIGTSGSEYGVRGYISAYDAETGELAWRFYTVPGDPAQPVEKPILAEAAKTWDGDWWKRGGGGAVWESISYDPDLNLIYFGVGNGTEWNQGYRSASKGDNWFLSSIVAINADTGDYVWHYQATPGEEWDYDAVQQLILADLPIDGVNRKVLMQANKNGFFYVLDRQTGKLISAQNFTPINWARGVDPSTGRPIENPDIRYDRTGKPASLLPGALGAHSWQAMAFNPKTGLVYIPAQEIGMTYETVKDFKPAAIGWNIGVATTNRANVKGYLIAWDPVKQKEVWRANYMGPWNGGILTTAGNLVFQGNAAGFFSVYRADTGDKLWSTSTQSAVMAAPITYEVDGEQFIAVLSGWGGAYPLLQGKDSDKSGNTRNLSSRARVQARRQSHSAAASGRIDAPCGSAARRRRRGDRGYRKSPVRSVLQRLPRRSRGRRGRRPRPANLSFPPGRCLVQHRPRRRTERGRHGAVRAGARSRAGLRHPRLSNSSRQRRRHAARRETGASARCKSWSGDRGARNGERRSGLRAMPCLFRRFGWQWRISADCRPVGILPFPAAATLQFRRASERHHVVDRPRALAGRYRRRGPLLCKRRDSDPAAGGCRPGPRQEGRAACRERQRSQRTSWL